MKQNITLFLDAHTLQRARELAAQQNLSVSKFLAADLAEQVAEDQRQALNWLKAGGLELGGDYLSRDEAHGC